MIADFKFIIERKKTGYEMQKVECRMKNIPVFDCREFIIDDLKF